MTKLNNSGRFIFYFRWSTLGTMPLFFVVVVVVFAVPNHSEI